MAEGVGPPHLADATDLERGPASGLRRPIFRDLSAGSFDMRTIRSSAWRCEVGKVLGCRAMTA
jgi:hypothetical protein